MEFHNTWYSYPSPPLSPSSFVLSSLLVVLPLHHLLLFCLSSLSASPLPFSHCDYLALSFCTLEWAYPPPRCLLPQIYNPSLDPWLSFRPIHSFTVDARPSGVRHSVIPSWAHYLLPKQASLPVGPNLRNSIGTHQLQEDWKHPTLKTELLPNGLGRLTRGRGGRKGIPGRGAPGIRHSGWKE